MEQLFWQRRLQSLTSFHVCMSIVQLLKLARGGDKSPQAKPPSQDRICLRIKSRYSPSSSCCRPTASFLACYVVTTRLWYKCVKLPRQGRRQSPTAWSPSGPSLWSYLFTLSTVPKSQGDPKIVKRGPKGDPISSKKGTKRGPFWRKRGPKIRIFQNCSQRANMQVEKSNQNFFRDGQFSHAEPHLGLKDTFTS